MQEEEESTLDVAKSPSVVSPQKLHHPAKKSPKREESPPSPPPPSRLTTAKKEATFKVQPDPSSTVFAAEKTFPIFLRSLPPPPLFTIQRCCRALYSAVVLLRIKRLWRKEEEEEEEEVTALDAAQKIVGKSSRGHLLPPAKAAAALPPLSPQPFFNTHARSPLPFCQNCLSAFVRSGGGGREGGSAGEISLDLGRGSLPCSACQKPTGRRGRRSGPFRGAAAGAAAAAVAKFPYISREHKRGRVRLLHRVLWLRMGKENRGGGGLYIMHI